MLSEVDRKHLQEIFQKKLVKPIKILNFTQSVECAFCADTHQLLEEISSLSDFIHLEVYNFVLDREPVSRFKIDKIPATVILGENDRDYGIRLYGIPSGYEFTTLIEDIQMISRGESGLSASAKEKIHQVTIPLHIQVFVTPTCPYCPRMVFMAHQSALENELISADMVEVVEFPHLGQKYSVLGVPKTVINDKVSFEGLVPEEQFFAYLLQASASS